jgi:DNA-binding response OmpR family regulator
MFFVKPYHGEKKYSLDSDEADSPTGQRAPLKKVLMLEDEVALTETLEPFFTDSGYRLVAVPNGVEGLKKIMAEDYSVIICDMVMPNLPGDMFYRAVERTKPHLCSRFIFITGFKGNRQIEDFIRKIKGVMIWKPFQTFELMEAVKLIHRKNGD